MDDWPIRTNRLRRGDDTRAIVNAPSKAHIDPQERMSARTLAIDLTTTRRRDRTQTASLQKALCRRRLPPQGVE